MSEEVEFPAFLLAVIIGVFLILVLTYFRAVYRAELVEVGPANDDQICECEP